MNEKEEIILSKMKQDLRLKELPKHSIDDQGNVIKLSLNSMWVTSIPSYSFELRKLKRLSLLQNKLETIPSSINNLTELEFCYLDKNQLRQLPDSFGELNSLKYLILSYNQLITLPNSIGKLNNLETLYLNDNQLKQLPESFGRLQNLTNLDLEKNQLNRLPESIGNFQNLKLLNLNENKLVELPETIGKLENLPQLQLESNSLKELPSSIGKLSKLTHLFLDDNNLTTLPPEIGQLENLEYLDLGYNKIEELPSTIGSLKKLKYLNLIANNLKELPETIGNLEQLSWLSIVDNLLIALPASIGQLTKLDSLFLHKNKLTNLPTSFWNLTQLKELWLTTNQIKSVPSGINQLNKLELLVLDDDLFKKIVSTNQEWIVEKRSPAGGTYWKIANKVCKVYMPNISSCRENLHSQLQYLKNRIPKRMKDEYTKKLLEIIHDLRKIGFFEKHQNLSDHKLLKLLQKQRRWDKKTGTTPEYSHIRHGAFKHDAMYIEQDILLHDTNRVWYVNLSNIENVWPEGKNTSMHSTLLKNWERISKGVFTPTEINEEWIDTKDYEDNSLPRYGDFDLPEWEFQSLSFKFNEEKYYFDEDNHFDLPSLDILQSIVNKLIKDSGYQLEDFSIKHSMYNASKYYVFLTATEKQFLENRGWKFRKGPNYADRIFGTESSDNNIEELYQKRYGKIKCPLCSEFFLEEQIHNKKKKIYCSRCYKYISCPFCDGTEFAIEYNEKNKHYLFFCADCDEQVS